MKFISSLSCESSRIEANIHQSINLVIGRLRLYIWFILVAIMLMDIVFTDGKYTFQIDKSAISLLIAVIIGSETISLFCRYVFEFEMVATFTEVLALLLAGAFVTEILQYVAGASPFAYYDKTLLMLDRKMGFDWIACIWAVNQHPSLSHMLKKIYDSWLWQGELAVMFFLLTKRYMQIYMLLMTLLFACLICIIIFYFIPSSGIITYLHINPADYTNISMEPGYVHIQTLTQLRSAMMHTLTFPVKGLITFPSFHSCIAVILAWIFLKIDWLRWPLLCINLALLISVPVIGGHYLIDVLAGVLISILVICMTEIVIKRNNYAWQSNELPIE